jgi:hypothetical protein
MWTAASCGLFKVLLRHLPGGTEGNHEKSQPRGPAFQPKFEPGVSRLPVMNITYIISQRALYNFILC